VIGRPTGTVVAIRGPLVEAELPFARTGDGVRVRARASEIAARVTALHDTRALLAPFGALDGLAAGDRVECDPSVLDVPLGTVLLGRAVDAAGAPLDGGAPPRGRSRRTGIAGHAVAERRPSDAPCWTGVRAIDGPLAIGRGARIGVFGPPGAGKSTLLDAVLRGTDADAVVVGLVGERGREAERRLAQLDRRTTIVCATSDRAAAERVRAAETAFAQADALRARGLHVFLVIDSLARICSAARELALGAGEAAGRGGYPASVFGLLARLLERAGSVGSGSVTLVATVLSDGPDEHDPVSEAARAALDGHLVLSERLVRRGHFPAIDVARSASRTFAEVASAEHRAAARVLRAAVAALAESDEARALGLPVEDPFLVRCVAAERRIVRFLCQDDAPSPPERTLTELLGLADILDDGRLR